MIGVAVDVDLDPISRETVTAREQVRDLFGIVEGAERKVQRVVVVGRLVSRSWENNGEKRTVTEMQVDEVGPSLRYATAKVTRNTRGNAAQQQGGGSYVPPAGAPSEPPWASDAASEEPPF